MSTWLSNHRHGGRIYEDILLGTSGDGKPAGEPIPGIFIFSKGDPLLDSEFSPIFIGESDNVQKEAAREYISRTCIRDKRPAHLNVRYVENKQTRAREVDALLQEYGAPCNQ